jgi:hypothetical protein
MQELASDFSETRSRIEAQWENDGDDASTEDLRIALTRYRSFLNPSSQPEQTRPPTGAPRSGRRPVLSGSGRGR